MYKDKDKQREANRVAAKKYRDSMTDKGMTVIPKSDIRVIPDAPMDDFAVPAPIQHYTGPPRRGKDITKFEHLPPDVQGTIIRLTTNQDGTVDEQARTNRTAIAIDYQHKQPDRYYSTGTGEVG